MSTLPKLNSDYKYEMTLPVSGTKHSYRPYLVKEEKALLMANESDDQAQIAIAMRDTLESCVQGLDVTKLPLADMEYAFAQVRARSSGEVVGVEVECGSCSAKHKANINLLKATTTDTEYEARHSIDLTDGWILDVGWPSLDAAINAPGTGSEIEQAFALIGEVLISLRTPDGMWDFSDVSDEEKQEFIDSMNSEQLGKIKDYIDAMPQCKVDLVWTCPECFEQNDTPLIGMQSFFG